MKKNRNIIILFIVLSVVAVGLWISRSPGTFKGDAADFRLDDSSTVSRIFIGDKNNNSVTLARLENGTWTVNGKYQAQKLSVDLLLKTMVDMEVRQPVARSAQDNIIKEMAVNAVKVEIYQRVFRIDLFGKLQLWPREKLTKVYYVGGATPDNQGAFMLMEKADEPYIIVLPGFRGFVSPRYSPIEKYWRDYNVFRTQITAIESVVVDVPGTPGYSYRVEKRPGNRFALIELTSGKELPGYDTLKMLNFLSGFRNLNFEALINDMDKPRKDSILASRPFIVISLKDTSGVTKTIKTFHKAGPDGQTDDEGRPLPYDMDRLYALVNDGKDFTLIQYFNFDKVLRPLPFFLSDGHSH